MATVRQILRWIGVGAVTALVPGCSLPSETGPLAVIDTNWPAYTRDLTDEGVLRITRTCVLLEVADGPDVLPAFNRDDVLWKPGPREIYVQGSDDEWDMIRDGDRVVFSGEPAVPEETPMGPEGPNWVEPPDEDCEGEPWLVGDVSSID